jgi:hypothetical protein
MSTFVPRATHPNFKETSFPGISGGSWKLEEFLIVAGPEVNEDVFPGGQRGIPLLVKAGSQERVQRSYPRRITGQNSFPERIAGFADEYDLRFGTREQFQLDATERVAILGRHAGGGNDQRAGENDCGTGRMNVHVGGNAFPD